VFFRLKIPSTHFALDYVRAEVILLRVVARNLVLWDSISPTQKWVRGQIPALITDNLLDKAGSNQVFMMCFIVCVMCVWYDIWCLFYYVLDGMYDDLRVMWKWSVFDVRDVFYDVWYMILMCQDVDYIAIRRCYCNILAGCAMSIGLRWAGTHQNDARIVLMEILETFLALRFDVIYFFMFCFSWLICVLRYLCVHIYVFCMVFMSPH